MNRPINNPTIVSGSLTNSFQYTARENDTETGLYCYRARYYDQSIGRFLSEDPFWIDIPDARISAYAYVENGPTTAIDPLGLYQLATGGKHPPVPPSPRLDRALRCLEGCYGKPLVLNSTSEPTELHKPGTPHRRGEAADIAYPADPAALLCCAAGCNFQFGLDEKIHPSRPGAGAHIHVQFTPATAANVKNHPEWSNGIHGDLPPASTKCACGTGALP
jgi:RHS repeat-associated protein